MLLYGKIRDQVGGETMAGTTGNPLAYVDPEHGWDALPEPFRTVDKMVQLVLRRTFGE